MPQIVTPSIGPEQKMSKEAMAQCHWATRIVNIICTGGKLADFDIEILKEAQEFFDIAKTGVGIVSTGKLADNWEQAIDNYRVVSRVVLKLREQGEFKPKRMPMRQIIYLIDSVQSEIELILSEKTISEKNAQNTLLFFRGLRHDALKRGEELPLLQRKEGI